MTEGDSGVDAAECAGAAGRVYDKLAGQLAPLLGLAGVQSLFARSAKLARAATSSLAEVAAANDTATKLRACLQTLEPATASAAAAVVFGIFLDLIVTFIGDRLTVQVLRGAWPAINKMAPRETNK